MNLIALLLDGPPPTWMFARYTALNVCGPAIVIIGSRLLIRSKKSGIWWALAMAIAGGWAARWSVQPLISWGYPYDPRWVDLWSAFAAAVPFVAIVIFNSRSKKSYPFLLSVMIFAWAYFGFGAGDPPEMIRGHADVFLKQLDDTLAKEPLDRSLTRDLHEELKLFHKFEVEAYDRRMSRLAIAGGLITLLVLAATLNLDPTKWLKSLPILADKNRKKEPNSERSASP